MERPVRYRNSHNGQRLAFNIGLRRAADVQLPVAIPFNGKPESVQPDRPDPHFLMKQWQERD
ncbi:MAG TPA: hypothetical protein VIK49_07465, partial [Steroidobacteraceae bacterium]